MPVLNKLNSTVQKIEKWKEDCSRLQNFIGILLGESGGTSISDISNVATPIGIKKKKINETIEKVNPKVANEVDRVEKANSKTNVRFTSPNSAEEIDSQTNKIKSLIKAGDEEPDSKEDLEKVKDETSKPIIFPEASVTKIRKTLDVLKTDSKLNELVNRLFTLRSSGNIKKSSEVKSIIDEYITNRGLDSLTVYASYVFPDLNKDNEESKDQDDQDDIKDQEDQEDQEDTEDQEDQEDTEDPKNTK